MRSGLLLLALAAGNLIGYAFLTRPARARQAELEARRLEVEEAIRGQAVEVSRWEALERVVEHAQSVMGSSDFFREGGGLTTLRDALLDAEQGLPLRREVLEFRPEEKSPEGFRGYRVHVRQEGSFAELLAYLDRVSRLGAPLGFRELDLTRDPKQEERIVLDVTWLALWPEGSEP